MKYYLLYVYCIFVLLGSSSCHRDADQQLSLADGLMWSRPDSALSILESLNIDKADVKANAWHTLMMAKAKTKLHRTIKEDSLLSKSIEYYVGKNDSLEIQSKFYYGMQLSQVKNYDQALIQLTLAYDLANQEGDYLYKGLAARELNTIYNHLFMSNQALYWALLEKESYLNGGYITHAAWADLDIISGYMMCSKYDDALNVIQHVDSSQYFISDYFRNNVNGQKSNILHCQKHYSQAADSYVSLLNERGTLTSSQWSALAEDYLNIGKMHLISACLDSAYVYAENSLDSVRVWYVDAQLKAHEGDYRKAYEIAMKFGEGIMRDGDERLASPPVMPLVDTLRENLAMERRLAAEERTRAYLITAIGLLAVAVLVLVIFLQRNRLKNRERDIETALAHAGELDRYLTALKEKSAEDHRRYEAACRKVEELDGEIRNERELSGDVIAEIRSLYSSRMGSLNRLFEIWHRYDGTNVSPKHFYKNMTDELEKFRGGESLSEMEAIIDRHYDGWMRRFREEFPCLSRDQYALTVYLFLGFSVGAITMLMGKSSVNAVYTAKSRLKSQLMMVDNVRAVEFRKRLGL